MCHYGKADLQEKLDKYKRENIPGAFLFTIGLSARSLVEIFSVRFTAEDAEFAEINYAI
jgi:hypothetical protein